MRLLAIDTATEACSVALVDAECTILERYVVEPKGHSNLVLSMVDSLLSESGIACDDLDAIGVDIGPGSFTGVRIGVGIAQGLSFGLKLPLIGVSSLMVLAEGLGSKANAVLPAIDARMGEVYWGRLMRDLKSVEGWAWTIEPTVTGPSLVPRLEVNEIGVGSAWKKYSELGETNVVADIQASMHPRATWLATIARKVLSAEENHRFSVAPQYVRNNVVR